MLNQVQLIGHLGRDPEVRHAPSGDAIANVNLATTEKWKDRTTGEIKEATEWHRISLYGKLAEIARDYLKKGSRAYFQGSLRTRKYTDKNGIERTVTEIRADTLKLLDRPDNRPPQQPPNSPAQATATAQNDYGLEFDDDIPF